MSEEGARRRRRGHAEPMIRGARDRRKTAVIPFGALFGF
jgi:hypothetical protein